MPLNIFLVESIQAALSASAAQHKITLL